jgi:beta-glucanase (GH16 family)
VLIAAALVAVGALAAAVVVPLTRDDATPKPVRPPDASGWVTRMSAGSAVPVTDSLGRTWAVEHGEVGGRPVAARTAVSGTGSPQLFAHARVGVTGYRLAVPAPGTYVVEVSAAETMLDAPGRRVFDVAAEGRRVAANLDLFARVGRAHPYHLLFTVPVTDGELDLSFTARVGEPQVSAVAAAWQSADTGRTLAWADEFDGGKGAPPDPSRWVHEVGGSGWGNGELQSYTDRADNAHLDGDGHLQIVARAEQFTGGDGRSRDFTSARLNSRQPFDTRYGLLEARVDMPAGTGLWPGFWAMGRDLPEVGWPAAGEIDIMEGDGGHPDSVFATLHGPDSTTGSYAIGRAYTGGSGSAGTRGGGPSRLAGFHTYTALWTPLGVRMAVDGYDYSTIVPSDLATTGSWTFDKPFFLLLNLAVGGAVPGPPDASTPFPAAMSVDYVRVYR